MIITNLVKYFKSDTHRNVFSTITILAKIMNGFI